MNDFPNKIKISVVELNEKYKIIDIRKHKDEVICLLKDCSLLTINYEFSTTYSSIDHSQPRN